MEANLLPHIVSSLKDPSIGVRAAACQCARALSRSANMLRTSLVDAGAADPLFDLLSDEEDLVKITATATVCNLLIDFSPMKEVHLHRVLPWRKRSDVICPRSSLNGMLCRGSSSLHGHHTHSFDCMRSGRLRMRLIGVTRLSRFLSPMHSDGRILPGEAVVRPTQFKSNIHSLPLAWFKMQNIQCRSKPWACFVILHATRKPILL